MFKRVRLLFLLLLVFLSAKSQQTSEVEQLFARFKAASNFDRTYPREKVYLQLDNSAYLEGDSLWYKAYVVRASSLLPTTLSRVLYVDLLNADGQLMERQTLPIDSLGQADGCFSLQLPVRAGYYEVRAYTREMTNWGTEACFSRVVPVFTSSEPNKGLNRSLNNDIAQLSLPEPEENAKVSLASPRPYAMKSEGSRLLTFYPEGGLRVKNVAQRIAFKLTDGRGRAVDDTIGIFTKNGELIGSYAPFYDGMGSFMLPNRFDNEGGYAMVLNNALSKQTKNMRYELPKAESAFSVQTKMETDGLFVSLTAGTDSAAAALVGLAVVNREKTCYFDTLTIGREGLDLLVPMKALRGGVNRVELFGADGRSFATRLVWKQPTAAENRTVKARVRQNAATYEAFQPAMLDIEVRDAQNRAVKTTLSLAVRDRASDITDTNDGGIGANMLLSSELRGYIHRPDLYFVKNDPIHREMLDLLLMVQGWRANTFSVMCGTDTFKLKQPIEDKLILRGTLYELNNKRVPRAYFPLKLLAYSPQGGSIEGETRTDGDGRFAFEANVNYTGNFIAQFTTKNDDGKRKWSRLMLDRWFAPQPRALMAPDLELHLPAMSGEADLLSAQQPELFQWTDTVARTISLTLGEVEVKARKKYKGFTGNRYTYNGGETTGMSRASKYYNMEWLVEELKDHGVDCSDSFSRTLSYADATIDSYENDDLMNSVRNSDDMSVDADAQQNASSNDGGVNGKTNDSFRDMHFKNRRIDRVYFNNMLISGGLRQQVNAATAEAFANLTGEQTKSVAIVFDGYATDAVSGQDKHNSQGSYSMYVYEMPDFYKYRSQKGVDRRRIQGFTMHSQFYAPDYRKADLPNAGDIRRTLHWAPKVQTNADGKANVLFYTNAREQQQLDITVRGVTANGLFIE